MINVFLILCISNSNSRNTRQMCKSRISHLLISLCLCVRVLLIFILFNDTFRMECRKLFIQAFRYVFCCLKRNERKTINNSTRHKLHLFLEKMNTTFLSCLICFCLSEWSFRGLNQIQSFLFILLGTCTDLFCNVTCFD